MNGLAPDAIKHSVLNSTSVDTKLHAAGLHVALVVDSVGRVLQNIAVLTADGQRAAAQVAGDLTVILYAALFPHRQQGRQRMLRFLAAANLHHFHGDGCICQNACVDVPELLNDVPHQIVEVRLRRLAVRLHRPELRHGAADGDQRAGGMGQVARTRIETYLHGLVQFRCAHRIGCLDLAVLVCRGVGLRAGVDAPLLVRAAVAGGQCVLQSKSVLVQRRLRAIPASDGQRTTEVGNARTAVCHGDLHRIAQIFQ